MIIVHTEVILEIFGILAELFSFSTFIIINPLQYLKYDTSRAIVR